MIRQALHARIKPGMVAEYKRIHDEVPTKYPDLAAAIRKAGIYREVVFTREPLLIVYAEVTDPDAYPRLWATEVHKRWAELMAPMMETGADGLAEIGFMDNIWEIDLTDSAAQS
jgi:L-rhamnose mutarotase